MNEKTKKLALGAILLLAVLGGVALNFLPSEQSQSQETTSIEEDGYLLLEEETEVSKVEAYDNDIRDDYQDSSIDIDLDNMFSGVEDKEEEEAEKEPEVEIEPVPEVVEPEPVVKAQPKPVQKRVVRKTAPVQVKSTPEPKKPSRPERNEREGFYGSKDEVVVAQNNKEFREDYDSVEKTRLHCSIFKDQTINNGSRVTFRALDSFEFQGHEFPKNTLLYGTAKFEQNRILVNITQASVSQRVVSVSMDLFDQDGGQGIYSSELSEFSKTSERKGESSASRVVNNLAGSLTKGYLSGVGELVTAGDSNMKVDVYDGYDVYAVF